MSTSARDIRGPAQGGSTPPRALRLLGLIPRPLERYANTRFRIEQWAPILEREHGIHVHFSPFESPALAKLMDTPGRRGRKLVLATRDLARRWISRHEARDYDGAIVVTESSLLGGVWLERYLVRNGIPFIYDFDDPLWLSADELGDWTTKLWRSPTRSFEISRLATAVTVGNEYLASHVRPHNPNVHVVHTSIDLERYRVLPPRNEGPFTIVWTGQRGASMRFLETIRPALERLGARMPVRLRVISDEAPAPYANVTLDFVRWSPAIEVSALGEGDVGIMPIPDTPLARGKCGLKALQYMAVGRAAVVSPVGINAEIVRDGENGLWATTEDEWVTQLERLAKDARLRDRLARAGRATVEQHYTARASAASFARVARLAIKTSE